MKRIDKLITAANNVLSKLIISLFPDDSDSFLDALGIQKEKYAVAAADGTVGYDFLSALDDIAKEDWCEDDGYGEEERPLSSIWWEDGEAELMKMLKEDSEELPELAQEDCFKDIAEEDKDDKPKVKKKYSGLFGYG